MQNMHWVRLREAQQTYPMKNTPVEKSKYCKEELLL